jgi:hypothetical protein
LLSPVPPRRYLTSPPCMLVSQSHLLLSKCFGKRITCTGVNFHGLFYHAACMPLPHLNLFRN